ncbi:MAG: hypothetical protein AB7E95_11940, partial [Kiritimatiellales bacterium]
GRRTKNCPARITPEKNKRFTNELFLSTKMAYRLQAIPACKNNSSHYNPIHIVSNRSFSL